jgi:uncharacterized protein with LGFP repeats
VEFGIVHHTAGGNNYGPNKGKSIVQGIQKYHMEDPDNPLCDIGYNFLVDKYGNSYVGRAGSTRVENPVQGAHTSGFNDGSAGVAVLGNYETSSNFPGDARRALADVLAWRFLIYDVDPFGVTGERHDTISGHKDFPGNSTECPGVEIYSRLENIRTKTANRMT